ncbi:Vacuolar ATP synthase subunit C [Entomophthora muscae]|uniref:Vacuolar ATP synthase subunit C n=1 Tax=Entomophthora muscae TaxID=34485 RepID=A0ACC2RQ98_9FUNG|nr:Vacuolar ATP synthase subunit C [Entomophthora muscae]
MASYWLVSLPTRTRSGSVRGGDRSAVFNQLRSVVSPADAQAASDIASLTIPELKVGTLDSLVLLSDELVKFDQSYESTVLKMVESLRSCFSSDPNPSHFKESLKINGKSVHDYLRSFSWNTMKYRTDRSLKDIVETINQEMTGIESQLKSKSTQYNAIKGSLTALERKQTGNLSVCSLSSIVGREHTISGSEHLTTIFVAVPRNSYKSWETSYESLTQMVVPRSSSKIAEDSDFGLFSVVLFRRVVHEFTQKCRELKFAVRDYEFSEEKVEEDRREAERIESTEKELWKGLVQWCQASFGDAFSAWFHIKVLRAFTESVLRYGLPPDFSFAIIQPRNESKLEKAMVASYEYLGGSRSKANEEASTDDPELAVVSANFAEDQNYCPYVRFTFRWAGGEILN